VNSIFQISSLSAYNPDVISGNGKSQMNSFFASSLPEKYNRLSEFAKTFWPDLDSMSTQRRLVGTGDVLTFLYTLPIAVIGLIWLVFATDLLIIQQNLVFLLINFGLFIIFSRLSFFTIIEIRSDRYGSTEDSFASMIQWSAVFLIGPSALWLGVIYSTIDFLNNWRSATNQAQRWSLLRTISVAVAVSTFAYLVSIEIYEMVGGSFPLPGLSIITIFQGFTALGSEFILVVVIMSGYLIYHIGVQKVLAEAENIQPIVRFFLVGIALPFLAHPFSILLTGLLVVHGYGIYAFLLMGLVLVAYIARRLSLAAESSRQQSRQLEKLEKLGRDLLEVIPDISSLPEILEDNVPGMFPSGRISIWISPNVSLLKFPSDWDGFSDVAWEWIIDQSKPRSFTAKEILPWSKENEDHLATVISPIFRRDSGRAIGGIALELRALAQPWDKKSLRNLFPALQSLSDQIASTLQQTKIYEQSLDFQQISQELRLAGQIQASFLPNKFPSIPGWQLAVTLLPARETSGDFFDVIELSDGRLGILVADVADKGVGSALYMALSRTLIRTYAEEYGAEPEVVFFATNNRLLKDARANLFITTFYGILDPEEGLLTYCNAGHNPPYLIRESDQETIISLQRTGIAMGIEENSTWTTETVAIDPGDILILYTDGIPDAQDEDGDFFNDEAIIEISRANSGKFAHEIQTAIIDEVQKFSGSAPQSDDITLMVLMRNK
jgi:serine phosphatase RsbU (regulator of sigma subunit)